jgi:hypothetical protein
MIRPDPNPVLLQLHAYIDAFTDQLETEKVNLLGQGSDSTSHERTQFFDAFVGVGNRDHLSKDDLGFVRKLLSKFHIRSMGE